RVVFAEFVFCTSLACGQGGSTTDDLGKFGGDGCLAGLVVGQLKRFQQFACVVGGFVHGCHPCSVLGGVGIQYCFVKLGLDRLRDQFLNDGLFGWLNDVIGHLGNASSHILPVAAHGLCTTGCGITFSRWQQRQQLLGGQD